MADFPPPGQDAQLLAYIQQRDADLERLRLRRQTRWTLIGAAALVAGLIGLTGYNVMDRYHDSDQRRQEQIDSIVGRP